MANTIHIGQPELLQFPGEGAACYGANQEWYPTKWQRQAGCGPTVCSHLLWYLSQTRPRLGGLCHYCRPGNRETFLHLMEEVWHYVTPGAMGVNSTAIFTEGALRFARAQGLQINCDVLEICPAFAARPTLDEVKAFVGGALARDLPVAFLNLSNGHLENLDGWHWVTLIALETETACATMFDAGCRQKIDLGLWLRTSKLGGGFVVLAPAEE